MARIFTTSFTFNEETHNIVVTVKTTPFYMEYTISNLDESLALLLPGNKIISSSRKHFVFPNAQPHHSHELMGCIIRAVTEHLQTVSF